jgi:hypothetical protein
MMSLMELSTTSSQSTSGANKELKLAMPGRIMTA